MYSFQTLGRRSIQGFLLMTDGLLLLVAVWLAHSIRFQRMALFSHVGEVVTDPSFWVILGLVYFSQYIFDLYEPRGWRGSISSTIRLGASYVLATLLVSAWLYLLAGESRNLFGRGVFFGSMVIYGTLCWTYRRILQTQLHNRVQRTRWLLLASKAGAEKFVDDFKQQEAAGQIEWAEIENREVSPQFLKDLTNRLRDSWTAVISEGVLPHGLLQVLMHARLRGTRVLNLSDFYEIYWAKVPVTSLDNGWFAFTEGFSLLHSRLSTRLKRVGDIGLSFLLLVLLLPVMLILWVLIRLESRGPAIYTQKRVGLEGKHFVIFKFRSMRLDSEKGGAQWARQNDDRTTRIGRFIRKVRLDETPQLINILKGQMSFIGPRPERPEFIELLSQGIPFYELRHLVKPGLTGWAQVMYPYGASLDDAREKLEYDLYYIKNYSIELDLKIIVKTISVVLFGAGR